MRFLKFPKEDKSSYEKVKGRDLFGRGLNPSQPLDLGKEHDG
jgi:hypothetical protein